MQIRSFSFILVSMKKILAVLIGVCLLGCGEPNPLPVDESIQAFKLTAYSAIATIRSALEESGAQFWIEKLPSGDVPVCNKPVPIALIDLVGIEEATDLVLATCLAEGQGVEPKKFDIRETIKRWSVLVGNKPAYDSEALAYRLACVEALNLGPTDWHDKLPFRKQVLISPNPYEAQTKANQAIMDSISKMRKDFGFIVNNMTDSGGPSDIVQAFNESVNEFDVQIKDWTNQSVGPVLEPPDPSEILKKWIEQPYENNFGKKPEI